MPPGTTKHEGRLRLSLFAAFFCLWIFAICGRLLWLQVVEYGFLTQKAARQQQRSIEVSPPRGVIYDRKGRALAMSVQVDSVFAVPSEIPDQASTAKLLAHILKTDPKEMLAKLESSRSFTWIARKLDNNVAARLRALNLKGIYFQKEPKRFYPKNDLAAQVIGYVGMDDDGLAGIERSFNQRLSGRPGKMLISMDARHRWFGRVEKNPEPGQNLVLTIDEDVQHIAEKELDAAMQKTHAEAGTVVIQNPKTGEILALANRPTFDPNNSRGLDPKSLKNRAVSDVYEPGSTFKMVTIAAALEERITNPNEIFDCQMGSIVVGGVRIHDWKPYGLLTVSQILERSSDVGAIKIAMRLGEDRMYKYIRGFGFGSQTGIELSGETRGITKPVNRWSKMSIGAISMGQEIGVSPLQLVTMTSSIANDGIWTPPRIVAGSTPVGQGRAGSAQTVVFRPGQQHRVISTFAAAEMKRMLEGVVLQGTGKKAILDGYTSAGKTGTAQKINPVTHRYDRVKHIASFSGFAPVNNPAITVTVILDSPVGAHHGGDVAAPIFNRIAQQVLEYLDVPHDVEVRNPQRMLLRAKAKPEDEMEGSPDHVGEEVAENDNQQDSAATVVASAAPSNDHGVVPAAYRQAATVETQHAASSDGSTTLHEGSNSPLLPRTGTVVLDVDAAKTVPSFLGKPVRTVIEESQKAGLEVDIFGSGVARQQNPMPGARLPTGGHVTVQFAR
ncbi:MAG TPA: penicillin-binding protein [Terriglobales bacterium]|jgi:cell division protein FtsI (penicillin-binding protein 3)|nr:penicillin-binding protein [Terriglobales bacterium]